MWLTLQHLLLPAVCLGVGPIATVTRIPRTSMVEVLQKDFVRTGRAMGLPDPLLVGKYALKNAFIATLTMIGVALNYMLAGSVMVESVRAAVSAADLTGARGAPGPRPTRRRRAPR